MEPRSGATIRHIHESITTCKQLDSASDALPQRRLDVSCPDSDLRLIPATDNKQSQHVFFPSFSIYFRHDPGFGVSIFFSLTLAKFDAITSTLLATLGRGIGDHLHHSMEFYGVFTLLVDRYSLVYLWASNAAERLAMDSLDQDI